jgi:YidC/Oxa1 family membrane protein insertase
VNLLGGSVGWAVIGLTAVVKIILAPLNLASIRSQIAQKKLQPEMDRIKKQYTDKSEQSQKIMELYKENKTNPFSGCLLILIQLPIILGLYYVFLKGLPILDPTILYKGIVSPESINMVFLGADLGVKSILFAAIAGVTQFIQVQLSPSFRDFAPKKQEGDIVAVIDGDDDTTGQDMMSRMGPMMQKQMKYVMPIIIFVVAMAVPAAVALYWITNNIMTIFIELIATWQEKRAMQEA